MRPSIIHLLIALYLPFAINAQTKTGTSKVKTNSKTVSRDSVGSKPSTLSTPQKDYQGFYLIKNGKFNKIDTFTCYNFDWVDSLKFVGEIKNEYEVYDEVRLQFYLRRADKPMNKPFDYKEDRDIKELIEGSFNKFEITEGKFSKRKYIIYSMSNPLRKYSASEIGSRRVHQRYAWRKMPEDSSYTGNYVLCCDVEKMKITSYQEKYYSSTNSYVKEPIYTIYDTETIYRIQFENIFKPYSKSFSSTRKKEYWEFGDEFLKANNAICAYCTNNEKIPYYYYTTELPNNCDNKFKFSTAYEEIKGIMRK